MAPRFPEGEVMRLPHAKGSFPPRRQIAQGGRRGPGETNTPAPAADQKDM